VPPPSAERVRRLGPGAHPVPVDRERRIGRRHGDRRPRQQVAPVRLGQPDLRAQRRVLGSGRRQALAAVLPTLIGGVCRAPDVLARGVVIHHGPRLGMQPASRGHAEALPRLRQNSDVGW